jgi:hypothetical protein
LIDFVPDPGTVAGPRGKFKLTVGSNELIKVLGNVFCTVTKFPILAEIPLMRNERLFCN